MTKKKICLTWIPGCKFPQAGPLALRQLSDFIRQSQCLRHATPNAIASRRVRTSYKSKLKLEICTRSHQLSTSSPGMTGATGARQVENIVLQRPRCSGGVYERHCALKFMSFSGLTRESTLIKRYDNKIFPFLFSSFVLLKQNHLKN